MSNDLETSKKALVKELVKLRMENRGLKKKIADKGHKVKVIKDAVTAVRDRMRKKASESDGDLFDDLMTYNLNKFADDLDKIVSPKTEKLKGAK